MTAIPHFDYPFRFSASTAVVAEQDSLEDVTNCVTAIFKTKIGTRIEVPDFGVPDLTFQKQPIGTADILDSVLQNEPRAVIMLDQHPDKLDSLIADLNVGVSITEVPQT